MPDDDEASPDAPAAADHAPADADAHLDEDVRADLERERLLHATVQRHRRGPLGLDPETEDVLRRHLGRHPSTDAASGERAGPGR